MVKNQNKSQRDVPVTSDEAKYKKKSRAKGQSRSKHKHEYDTVLLHRLYRHTDYKTGVEKTIDCAAPTKVCTICGRVGCLDEDASYYTSKPIAMIHFFVEEKELSAKALALPQWYCDDYFDKFAKRMEDANNE